MEKELIRLSKLMSQRGICSRREADEFISRGLVLVNGECIDELGTKVDPDSEIVLDNQAEHERLGLVTIILNKPVGYVSGTPEKGYTPAASLIIPNNHYYGDISGIKFRQSHLRGLAPAGRLDIDSTGLLVFTQDGRIAKQLIGGDTDIEKEYIVRVEGKVTDHAIELLCHGLTIDGATLRPAKVSRLNEDQLLFELKEGRKRQIRRMCDIVALRVIGLKRTRVGNVRLGDLPSGKWRYMEQDESF